MDDAPATPQPCRRRWKRWAVVTLILIVAVGLSISLSESRDVERARSVKLGMTEAEVVAIVGIDNESISWTSPNASGLVRGTMFTRWVNLAQAIERHAGRQLFRISFDSWPVHIRFDASGRVDRIKRGSEVIVR